jgi:hypothetical protein
MAFAEVDQMNERRPAVPRQLGDLHLVENCFDLGRLPVVTHDGRTAGSYVPRGFESGVRVLDAIHSRQLGRDLDWSDLSRTVAVHGVQDGVSAVLAGRDDSEDGEFVHERMRFRTLEAIEGIIANWSPRSSRCLHALSNMNRILEGLFDASLGYAISDIRNCYVYEGSLESWRSIWPAILPSLWWPTDRSWCLARDIDINWTFVAGPTNMTEQFLASDVPCASTDWDELMQSPGLRR